MSETNHTRSHEAIASGPEPTERDVLIEDLSDLGTTYSVCREAIMALEADAKALGEKDAEIARLNKHCDSYVEAHYKDADRIETLTEALQQIVIDIDTIEKWTDKQILDNCRKIASESLLDSAK